MLKKLRKLKLGYISIEVVILASIILVSGFSFLGAFVKNGQLASNDAANKIDSVLDLAGGGSGELPGGGLPGGGSFGDGFPIEWNTKEASNNVSFTIGGPGGESARLVKVSNFIPNEEQLRSAKCTDLQSGVSTELDASDDIEDGLVLFAYSNFVQGFVAESAGEYDYGYTGIIISVPEPGFYVLDLWGMTGEELDFVIDIKAPEVLPTSFPIEWNTKEASDNVSFTIEGSKLVKVGNFLPSEEQLSSAKCTWIQYGEVMDFSGYYDVVNGLAFFAHGEVQGIVAERAGEYDMGAGATLNIPEPGLYVLDFWGMFGEEFDFVIDIPEPPSFPIEWNTLEVAENNLTVEIWGSNTPLTKVSDMVPTTEKFLTTKLVENYNGSIHNFNLCGYQRIDENVTYFEYESDGYGSLWGAIIKDAGYSDYFEAEFPEPGIYVNHYSDDEIEYSINSYEVSSSFVPGLYESGSIAAYMNNGAAALEGKLIMSFYDLLDEGIVYIAGGSLVHIEPAPMSLRATYHCALQGDLFLPDIGIISNRILEYTFKNCNSITGILVPEGATSIGGLAFTGASSLETIVLPKSLEYIGYRAFGDAPLADIYYAGTESEWNAISIDGENQELLNATIHFNSRISK